MQWTKHKPQGLFACVGEAHGVPLRQVQWPAEGALHSAFWLYVPQAAPISLTQTVITHGSQVT